MALLDLGQFGHGAYRVKTKSRNARRLSLPWRPFVRFLCQVDVGFFNLLAAILGLTVVIGTILWIAVHYPLFFLGLLCGMLGVIILLGICQSGSKVMKD